MLSNFMLPVRKGLTLDVRTESLTARLGIGLLGEFEMWRVGRCLSLIEMTA